ncbi:hypothetical protein F5148DRAFT_352295 [Russula earlei]|uniref:Uncharacterized protein n=1 Tax=Russula earlei TaxID=71964 RepID=A0ACC0U109_9AGAM|nr:hypothetical protein F5148DRAFT_352295 [Russula earlei]
MSDCDDLTDSIPRRPAQSIVEPELVQDNGFARLSERFHYPASSFDALEFQTSPLPPSSPIPSSTDHGSPSLCQTTHGAEGTLLDIDRISLPLTVGDSYGDGSSSRRHDRRRINPTLASASSYGYLLGTPQDLPTFLISSSKANLISDLLTHDDPWNDIGDILDLPPIPSADHVYFGDSRSLDTPYEDISSPVSSSTLRQADTHDLSDSDQDEATSLKTAHSNGDAHVRSDLCRPGFLHYASGCTSSPLLCLDSPTKRIISPARTCRSNCEARLLGAESPCLARSPTSESIPCEAPFKPQAQVVSPRPLNGTSRTE